MFLTIAISALMFLCGVLTGNILMFLDNSAFYLCPLYIIFLILTKRFYKEDCVSLQIRDFIFTFVFVIIAMILYWNMGTEISFSTFCFVYLVTFLPFISFACSIRYKSLI